MTCFKYYAESRGRQHTTLRVFAGADFDHLANCGELCFRNEEAKAFLDMIKDVSNVQVVWETEYVR